ncbi:hypothetical protein CAPTEDRAFT_224584 [Capitella teleta]|uniref:Uncharacterized protein n=1 Tax=Capitella teleta TaxID=283909 RepID=R7VA88_CAPTE|nr:hypothetical protein CAPTEDRAFT_224584 [Capitella teleta]|eukprot:ELU15452.1 hypothetical protein CAPTEDRAFT_224584 [Capitella teleta]
MHKGIDQGYYTMKYDYSNTQRKSRWSLVRDAVDLEMLLHVADMDSATSLDPLLGSVSNVSLDERSSSPAQASSPPGSCRSESPSDDLRDDTAPLRRHSCGMVHSEQRNCLSCVRLLCSCAKTDASIPKSLSLPLRQQTPDPFPELTSPVTPSEPIQMDTSSKSSPSSPIVRQRAVTEPRKISSPARHMAEESPAYDEGSMAPMICFGTLPTLCHLIWTIRLIVYL